MRRAIVQTGAWAAATGAAVWLSWFGVHAVLSDSAFDPPRTLTVPPIGPGGDQGLPSASSTRLPEGELGPATARAPQPSTPTGRTTPPFARQQTVPGPRPTAGPSGSASGSGSPSAGAAARGAVVRSVSVKGGRVAVEVRADSAELVSATPEAGWDMQVWHGGQWLRVDFSRDGVTDSVFVTWNGHPPTVQTVQQ